MPGSKTDSHSLKQQAKWLLEYELEQNRTRRAEKAATEEMALRKRKAETAVETLAVTVQTAQSEASPNKKAKMDATPAEAVKAPAQPTVERSNQLPNQQSSQSSTNGNTRKVDAPKAEAPEASSAAVKETQTQTQPLQSKNHTDSALSVVDKDIPKETNKDITKDPMPEAQPISGEPQVPKDKGENKQGNGGPEQSPQNDDFNFESMFVDVPAGSDQNNSIDFNMELGAEGLESSAPFGSVPVPGSNNNLELLAGLESYANATNDDFTMLSNPNPAVGDQLDAQTGGNGFELPDMTDNNPFDDLLADNSFETDNALLDLDGGFFSNSGNGGDK